MDCFVRQKHADQVSAPSGAIYEADRVCGGIPKGETTFRDGWAKWAPPPTWKSPDLPSNWDDVTGR